MGGLSEEDQKLLQKIHRQFLDLERSSKDQSFNNEALLKLKETLKLCETSLDESVRRLTEIPLHLHGKMTLRHFVSYLVPVERLLAKSLQDAHFLVSSLDRSEPLQDQVPLVFVLDNIRSAFNVGSIFRTAECLNIEAVYLCGYTPTPEQDKVEKTALGTQSNIQWKTFLKTKEALEELQAKGYQLIAFETADKAKNLYEDFLPSKTAFIFGNERFGLDNEILNQISEVRKIPLRGQKNSLNVGVAAAVAGFEWVRQWEQRAFKTNTHERT